MRTQFHELSDSQWQVIGSMLPEQTPKKLSLREVANAILYLTTTGVQWRNLPKHYPKWQSVYMRSTVFFPFKPPRQALFVLYARLHTFDTNYQDIHQKNAAIFLGDIFLCMFFYFLEFFVIDLFEILQKTILLVCIYKKLALMMKKIILLAALLGFAFSAQAQNRKAIDSLTRVYRSNVPDTAKVLALHEIAREYIVNNPDSAIALATQGLQLSEKIKFGTGSLKHRNTIGAVYMVKGNYNEALVYFEQNLEAARRANNKLSMANSLNNMGLVYRDQDKRPKALECFQQSFVIYESINNVEGSVQPINNITSIYVQEKEYEKAMQYATKGVSIAERISSKPRLAAALTHLGNIYYYTQKYEQAIQHYGRAQEAYKAIGSKYGIALNINNIGLCYIGLGQYELGLEQLFAARKTYKEIKNTITLCDNSQWIAETYLKTNHYAQAKAYADTTLQQARQIKNLRNASKAYSVLYEVYKHEQQYIKAIEYLELYKQSNDSIFNIDNSKKIANLEAQTEIELLAKNKALLEKDNQLQKIELERQQNARLAIEKQAEADRLLALTRQEQDRRKQDSLRNLAQRTQLEADNLRAKEQQLKAESRARQLATIKALEAKEFQEKINYIILAGLLLLCISVLVIYRAKQQAVKAKQEVEEKNKEILEQKEEISQQKETLALQATELGKVNQTKDKLFAILGHDLRSPIASLEGNLYLMNMGMVSEQEFQEFVPHFHRNVKNIQDTLENLLQWSFGQMQGLSASPAKVWLYRVVDEKVQLFAEVARTKNIAISTVVDTNIGVWADADHVRLLLRNLINNAIKFTPEGGNIHITATWQASEAVIHIADTGLGMSSEQVDKLFKPNQTFSTRGTNGEKGTGLGLQLCQEIVAKNGGRIWASSKQGQGSTFSFSLPLAKENT